MIAAAAGVLGSACGSSAKSSTATTTAAPGVTVPRVPLRDRFVGTLHGGTGSLAGARDVVEVRLQAPGGSGIRRLTLWIVGTGCPAGARCVHPSGSLRGQLTPVHSLPDVGRRYALKASGSLGPVGVMTAAGTVAGTGNINSGFELLQLTLTGKRGSARLSARSGRVLPFTSP
ncbi:MAG TPA: hypothetical protein VFH80_28130 [Solirubrobacteraceae bacterium]|nr:hypothetical protein [Solirubrobacteraceae bacterium]